MRGGTEARTRRRACATPPMSFDEASLVGPLPAAYRVRPHGVAAGRLGHVARLSAGGRPSGWCRPDFILGSSCRLRSSFVRAPARSLSAPGSTCQGFPPRRRRERRAEDSSVQGLVPRLQPPALVGRRCPLAVWTSSLTRKVATAASCVLRGFAPQADALPGVRTLGRDALPSSGFSFSGFSLSPR
jgi:hypothetical protein